MSPEVPELPWSASPERALVRLASPLVLQLISFSLMSLVDTLFVGRLGGTALAAVGLGSIAMLTVTSFGQSVLAAARLLVGNAVGRGQRSEVERLLGVFLRLGIGLGVLSLFAAVAVAALLPWISADFETGARAGRYAAIRALGAPAILLSAALGQWLTGQSHAKAPMRAALVANLANIPLNALFLFGLRLGTDGSALATAIAHVVELLVLVLAARGALTRAPGERPTSLFRAAYGSSNADALAALRLGAPTGIERVLDMTAFAAVPVLLSYAGPEHIAAHQIALQVSLFAFLPLAALSDAASVLTAQAMGARAFGLIRRLVQAGLAIAIAFTALWSVLCVLLREPVAALFTGDALVLAATRPTLVAMASIQVGNAIYTVLKGILRGLGELHFVAWCTVLCAWLITPPLTYLFSVRGTLGAAGAWWAILVEVLFGLSIVLLRSQKKLRALRESANAPSPLPIEDSLVEERLV